MMQTNNLSHSSQDKIHHITPCAWPLLPMLKHWCWTTECSRSSLYMFCHCPSVWFWVNITVVFLLGCVGFSAPSTGCDVAPVLHPALVHRSSVDLIKQGAPFLSPWSRLHNSPISGSPLKTKNGPGAGLFAARFKPPSSANRIARRSSERLRARTELTLRSCQCAKLSGYPTFSGGGSPCYMILTHITQGQTSAHSDRTVRRVPGTPKWTKTKPTGWSRRRSCVCAPDGRIGRCSCCLKRRKCSPAPGPEVKLADAHSPNGSLANYCCSTCPSF